MLVRISLFTLNLFFFLLLSLSSSSLTHSPSPPIAQFNISHFLSLHSDDVVHNHSNRYPFLEGVLKEIAEKEKWNLEYVRVSKVDFRKAKFGALQRYEFRVRFGKSEFLFKMLDQVSDWKRLGSANTETAFEDLVREISSKAVLDSFIIQGPVQLSVSGDDHQLNLILPLNASFAGLKHILVGEGITVEVKGAKEASLLHSTDLRKMENGSAGSNMETSAFRYFWPSLCMAWLPVRILGSTTVVAYRTRNPEVHLETLFPSKRTVELLPEKCYSRPVYRKWGSSDLLSARIALLEKVLRTFLGFKRNQHTGSGSLNAKIISSSLFRFQLELERDIWSNDTYWSTLAEWRTKPAVERVWFEVVARVEAEVLKPVMIKKVKPFIEVDSKAWSNLMSNVSFTKFPSILVPQEALTLDVKW